MEGKLKIITDTSNYPTRAFSQPQQAQRSCFLFWHKVTRTNCNVLGYISLTDSEDDVFYSISAELHRKTGNWWDELLTNLMQKLTTFVESSIAAALLFAHSCRNVTSDLQPQNLTYLGTKMTKIDLVVVLFIMGQNNTCWYSFDE